MVYNAAIIQWDRLGELTAAQHLEAWSVNVVGAITAAAHLLPRMADAGGGTFLLTSGMPIPVPDVLSLSLGKAGVRALAEALHAQFRPRGVHVSAVTVAGAVAPGSAFDPDEIAEHYWRLHVQPPAEWEHELVYHGRPAAAAGVDGGRGARPVTSAAMEEPQQPPTPFPLDPFARVLVDTTEALVCVFDREGPSSCSTRPPCARPASRPRTCSAGTRRVRHPGRGAHRLPRAARVPVEDRLLQPAPRPLDDGRRGAPARVVVEPPARRRDGRAALPRHVRPRPDRPRAPARGGRQALEDDPELRLAQVGRLAQEQRALRRVATLVASEASPEQVFMVVSEESARVIDVDACAVMRYEADGSAVVMGRHHRDGIDTFHLGERFQPDDASSLGRVRRTGAPARVDDWGAQSGAMARRMARVGYRSTASAPIVVAGQLWGAVAIGTSDRCRRRARRASAPSASSSRWPSPARRPARTCTPPARASSRPATSSAAAWSATSTTARSSGSCRWR